MFLLTDEQNHAMMFLVKNLLKAQATCKKRMTSARAATN